MNISSPVFFYVEIKNEGLKIINENIAKNLAV